MENASDDPVLTGRIAGQLSAGEHVLWSGRPGPAATMRSKLYGPLFLVAFAAIGIWSVGDPQTDRWLRGLLLAGADLAAVFYLALVFVRAKGTLVAITSHRLLVVSRGGRRFTSIARSGIRQIERTEHSNGGVTLRIPTALVSDQDGGQKVDWLELRSLSDADQALRLLTKRLA